MALTDKGCFQVNGTEYKAQEISTSYESLASDDSGRTQDGVMHIYWVRRRVRKVSIEMPPTSDKAMIAQLLASVQGQEYNLTYWDQLENAEKTINVYTSTSKSDWYNGVIYNGIVQGVSFNAIELAGEV